MHQQRESHSYQKKVAEESVKNYFADLIDFDIPRDSRKAMNWSMTIEGPEGRFSKPDKTKPNNAHVPPRSIENII